MPMSRRGCFVVFEGIDGAGTTTQVERVARRLQAEGFDVLTTCEPTDGPVGRHIRAVLRGEATSTPEALALLFAADRLEHLDRDIQPALQAGRVVLCDRYVGSSLAYQGTELGDMDWVAVLNRCARAPDETFYLRIDPDEALTRIRNRDTGEPERYEHIELLTRIARAYDRVYGVEGEALFPAHVLDAALPADVLEDRITSHLLHLLGGA